MPILKKWLDFIGVQVYIVSGFIFSMMTFRRYLPILVLLVIVSTGALCSVIRDGSFSANSDGSNINLRWVSEDETGVLRYEIERKAGTIGQFMSLAQLALQGNNFSYLYVDDSAFLRTVESLYQYRIRVVFTNGTSAYFGPITVIHQVSSVRKTWGSIKAMFR